MIASLIFQQARQKRRELIMLVGMTALYFISYFQRVAVPGTVFNELQVDFNASAVAITALGALFLYIYGFWQIFCPRGLALPIVLFLCTNSYKSWKITCLISYVR